MNIYIDTLFFLKCCLIYNLNCDLFLWDFAVWEDEGLLKWITQHAACVLEAVAIIKYWKRGVDKIPRCHGGLQIFVWFGKEARWVSLDKLWLYYFQPYNFCMWNLFAGWDNDNQRIDKFHGSYHSYASKHRYLHTWQACCSHAHINMLCEHVQQLGLNIRRCHWDLYFQPSSTISVCPTCLRTLLPRCFSLHSRGGCPRSRSLCGLSVEVVDDRSKKS